MTGFLYRSYKKTLGPFYQGDDGLLPQTLDAKFAKGWYDNLKDDMVEVEVTLPPKEKIKVTIPVKEEGEINHEFEATILSDIRIDPTIRVIINRILTQYAYCTGGFFVKRKKNYHSKIHTKQMDVLQLMKDVILGFVRYDPIRLDYHVGKGSQRKRVEYDWDIAEDFTNVKYNVGNKNYTTNIFGVYTRKLRKSMFRHLFDFYGNHELQYFQRYFDLNYGASNYLCASRDSGKTYYGLYNTAIPMFKSPTFKKEFADTSVFKTHFFVKNQGVIENYSDKLKEFFHNLLVETYELKPEVAHQVVQWKNDNHTMYLHMANGSRPLQFISELASSVRGERSARSTLDECNYLKNYEEIADFASKSGAGSVNYISTISKDSKTSTFYKKWVEAMVITRKNQPIEEIIHHIWTKYGFDKIKSREDYRKMATEGTFDLARAEYYKMRTIFGMKVTLDDVEYLTEDEKIVRIDQSINSPSGYEGMLAEYYCELSPETPEIKYRPNIVSQDKIPELFDKIYAGYDEAEGGDEATLVIGGVSQRRLYVLEAHILPKQVGKRYHIMNEIMSKRAKHSLAKPSLILDIGRGPIYFRETVQNVKYTDMAIKARAGNFEKIAAQSGVSYYMVGTEYLVTDIMNNELIGSDMCFFSDDLGGDIELMTESGDPILVDGLFGQLDNYINENGKYKGKGKSPDDLVSAMLYMSYYAYTQALKKGAILKTQQIVDPIQLMDAQFEAHQKKIQQVNTVPKRTLWDLW